MQHVGRFRCHQTCIHHPLAFSSHTLLPQHGAVRRQVSGGASSSSRHCIVHAAPETPAAGSTDGDQPVVRRRRLFRAGTKQEAPAPGTTPSSSSSSSSNAASSTRSSSSTAAGSKRRQATADASHEDVLEGFAAAFESLAVAPKKAPRPSQYGSSSSSPRSSSGYDDYSSSDDDDLSFLANDPVLRQDRGSWGGRGGGRGSDGGRGRGRGSSPTERLFGRAAGGASYGALTGKGGGGWGSRGKAKDKERPLTLDELEDIDTDSLTPEKQRLLDQLKAEASEAERKRLLRKARSERIPTAPKPKQDPVIFQAMTRRWDEKMTEEELRGARASARKVARVGLYDRNRALKAVRRKAVQALKKKDPEELTEEEQVIAARAQQIRDAAAAKSIQRRKEELAVEARGVRRSYDRAEALPEGLWEELKDKYRSEVPQIKIGRKGATESLVGSIHAVWRNHEVVKLRIHDDKSARKMNLPRLNLLLRELEEMSGGVLLDCQGSSIWLFRGVDWVPPPPPPVYKPPPPEELLQEQYTPRGSWQDIGGVTCYVASSSSSAHDADSSSGSSSSGGVAAGAGDAMTLVMLPDHFPLADSKALLQVADKLASKGALVVLADVLGADPDSVNSNIAKQGDAGAGWKGANYWPSHRWPLVKKRKLEYMAWYQTGPGSWTQLRPKLLQLLEAMQQQGLYDADAQPPQQQEQEGGTPDADAAAAQQPSADAAADSSSSSSVQGRPLGLLGVGWGSFIGLHAAGDEAVVAAGAKVLVALSPATYNKDYDLTRALRLPVALLPAKYDTMDQVMMFINLLAKPWEQRCIFKRFGKVKPGWGSWLPQWSDPRAMRQVAEQLLTAVSWLRRELLGVVDGYELPQPQLPATAGPASQADVDKAAAQAAKKAAAELAEAEADAEGQE